MEPRSLPCARFLRRRHPPIPSSWRWRSFFACSLLLLAPALPWGCTTLDTELVEAGAAPVRHVVLVSFKPDTPASAREAVEKASAALPEAIPEIAGYEWGNDLNGGKRSEGLSHCIVFRFKDLEARDRYLVHPAHQQFLKDAKPYLERVLVLDYVPEPDAGED